MSCIMSHPQRIETVDVPRMMAGFRAEVFTIPLLTVPVILLYCFVHADEFLTVGALGMTVGEHVKLHGVSPSVSKVAT